MEVDPFIIEAFDYASKGVSILLFLTLSIFVPLLIWKIWKNSKLKFTHSARSKLKRIPYFTKLSDVKFSPSIFFPTGDLQTVLLPFLTFKEYGREHLWSYEYKREIFELADGGQIAMDWAKPRDPEKAARMGQLRTPILAVIPGLTGHNDDLYMVSTSTAAVENGFEMVMVNHRGWGNSKLTTPKFYSAGATNDLEEAIEHISRTHADRDIYLLGFSIGANILANYLANLGDKVPAKAAMCVGNPYDLIKVSEEIPHKLFGLYNKVLTDNLKRKITQHLETLRPLGEKLNIDLEDFVRTCTTIRQIDETLTCTQFGYESVEEYYGESSCWDRLKYIKTPTLFLNALDDPIFDKKAIPHEEFLKNDNIMLATTNGGGHIGYLHGSMKIEQWFTVPIFEFFNYFRNPL
jgi:predicted alpha/beta-fold hydrolase